MLSRLSSTALRNAARSVGSVRNLNLHEYQSKLLLEKHHIQTQTGSVAFTPSEAKGVAENLLKDSPGCDLVLKAQVHAGGRGKGYFVKSGEKKGVRILATTEEVEASTAVMIGDRLVTKQTTDEGQEVNAVLINKGIDIVKEYYFAILLDRSYGGPVLVVSTEGGMNIEEVAETNPELIVKIPVDIANGCGRVEGEKVADALKITDAGLREHCVTQTQNLYNMFIATDATQVEINPLAIASDDKMYCVDAKLNFDDNASFRQKEIFDQADLSLEDPRELEAAKFGLNYISLDGEIGCMVNGAGLAMATMDIIKLNGGSPANFLDVGGGATKEAVTEAFKILTSDSQVKGLLVNIFGGIMKCDVIAAGIIAAYNDVGLQVPLVVRLEGTNVAMGVELLKNSGLPIITAENLDDAAIKAVAAINAAGK